MAISNNTAPDRVDMESLRERADKAFEDFDFGAGVEVTDHNGWSISHEHAPPTVTFEKTVFITLPDDKETDPTHAATFKVSFLCYDKSGAISHTVAVLRGESIGSMVVGVSEKITKAQNEPGCDLNLLADILDGFFGMTDSEDPRFVDSQSDAIEYLWRHERFMRHTIEAFRANMGDVNDGRY